jgi:hypothetical protein
MQELLKQHTVKSVSHTDELFSDVTINDCMIDESAVSRAPVDALSLLVTSIAGPHTSELCHDRDFPVFESCFAGSRV